MKFRRLKITIPILVLAILFAISGMSLAEQGKKSRTVLVNANIHESSGDTGYGFYRIDTATGKRELVKAPGAAGLQDVRISPDRKFILGKKYDRKSFINELFLVNLKDGSTFNLVLVPDAMVFHDGRLSGTFSDYGFSSDSRFALVEFPSGVEILKGAKETPLMPGASGKGKFQIALIDIGNWTETRDKSNILLLDATGLPSFSKSGRRLVVPFKNRTDGKSKAMLYEIEAGKNSLSERVFGYELPFSEISQASFASDNLLYILSGDELLLYDVIGSRILRQETVSALKLRSGGFKPPYIPSAYEYSYGPLGFGLTRFGFVSEQRLPEKSEEILEGGPGFEYPIVRNRFENNKVLIFGDTESATFDWIPLKKNQSEKDESYLRYFNLYFPPGCDRKAVLSINSWTYQGFSIVDFEKKKISDFIPGFFIGMSGDTMGVLYVQCGNNNGDSFRGYSNFKWESLTQNGKSVGMRTNQLYYWNLETDEKKLLLKNPSHTSEAFFLD